MRQPGRLFGSQLSTQKPEIAVNRLRFQALHGWGVSAFSKARLACLSSLLLPGWAPVLSQGSPVLGKVSGPTAWDPPSAFDLCHPLKSPRPQLQLSALLLGSPGSPPQPLGTWVVTRVINGAPADSSSSSPSLRRPRGRAIEGFFLLVPESVLKVGAA